MPEPSLRRAGAIVLGLTICAKLAGFIREAVVAGTFGTTRTVDLYLAAVIVPAIVTNVLYQGLPNAFVPLFTSSHIATKVRRLAISLIVISVGIAGLMWFLAPWAASLTSGGFPDDLRPEIAALVRIGSLAILAAMIEALARSRLIARKRFAQSGIGPLWSSLTIILLVVFFADAGAHVLMWGFVLGTAAMALWNLLPFERRPEDTVAVAMDDVTAPSSWVLVVLTVTTAGLLYGLIDRHLGSFLPEGSLAALQYANTVASQPVAICGVALSMAVFPYLAQRIASGDRNGATALLERAGQWALLGVVPSTVFTVFYGPELMRILLERGQFGAESRLLSGGVLAVYGLWMLPTVLGSVVAKLHYSTRGVRALLWATFVGLSLKAGVSIWFVGVFGIAGLAGSSVVAVVGYVFVLAIMLPGWCSHAIWRAWLKSTAVLGAIALIGSLAGFAARSIITLPSGKLDAYVPLAIAVGICGALLLLAGPRLGVPELRMLASHAMAFLHSRGNRRTG